jgi:hypothetical protein
MNNTDLYAIFSGKQHRLFDSILQSILFVGRYSRLYFSEVCDSDQVVHETVTIFCPKRDADEEEFGCNRFILRLVRIADRVLKWTVLKLFTFFPHETWREYSQQTYFFVFFLSFDYFKMLKKDLITAPLLWILYSQQHHNSRDWGG